MGVAGCRLGRSRVTPATTAVRSATLWFGVSCFVRLELSRQRMAPLRETVVVLCTLCCLWFSVRWVVGERVVRYMSLHRWGVLYVRFEVLWKGV